MGPEDPVIRATLRLLREGALRELMHRPPRGLEGCFVPTDEEAIEGPYWGLVRMIREGESDWTAVGYLNGFAHG